MSKKLIVFTRYPEPGKTKTRLIPALGPDGAADLQRRMTEHTLRLVPQLQRSCPVSVEVCYDGGSLDLIREWLGRDLSYAAQGGGDLGERMARAFDQAFDAGTEATVIVGTDCPGVTADLLRTAFEALRQNDLVLGPANDGGYYLIGLCRAIPQLFAGIHWGTDKVLQQTLETAKSLELSVTLLERLDDVDRPEDLRIWEQVTRCAPAQPHADRISIIIPTLNEAAGITTALDSANRGHDVEVIVVDGGSSDGTVDVASSHTARVLTSPPGRARQMNAGAAEATGEFLLFLHADTRLPAKFDEHVRRVLARPGTAAGAFKLHIDGSSRGLRLIERATHWRSQLLKAPYGDQAIFVRAELFHEIGGFPDMAIMEDLELIRRLRRRGRIVIAPAAVITSPRRWLTLGVFQATLTNLALVAAYYMGVPPSRLARWYNRNRRAAIRTAPCPPSPSEGSESARDKDGAQKHN